MSTINTILIKRRLPDSPLDTLPVLSGGELGFNEKNYTLYYGASGLGTIPIAGPGAFVDRTTNQTVSGEKWFEDKLTVDNNLIVSGYVTASSYKINETEVIDSSRNASFVDINASGNVVISGDLSVLGATTTIETTTTVTSSFKVENFGTTTALEVTQVNGTNDVAVFKDGVDTALIVKGDGNVGVGTATPNEKLTVFGSISASSNIFGVNGDFTGTLDVDQAVTFGSNLTITGNITGTAETSTLTNFIIDGGSF